MGRVKLICIAVVMMATVLLASCEPAYAEDKVSCKQWALMVQQFDAMPPETRAKWSDQLSAAPRNSERVRAAMKAMNYLNAGGAVRNAWRQCPSI